MLQIKRNTSTDISAGVQWKTVQITEVLTKEVSKLQFTIYKTPATTSMIPVVGDQIDVYENSVHIFGGTCTNVEITIQGGVLLAYQISCVLWDMPTKSFVRLKLR